MSRLEEEFEIIRRAPFLTAVNLLKHGLIDAIYGPRGGIVILDERGCLVHRLEKRKLYFSADDYLGEWKCLWNRPLIVNIEEENAKLLPESADKIDRKRENEMEHLTAEQNYAKDFMIKFCKSNAIPFIHLLAAYRLNHPTLTLGQALIDLFNFFRIKWEVKSNEDSRK